MTQDAWEPSVSEPTGQSPLREFEGVLVEIGHDDREYEGRKTRDIEFDFTDLNVIDAIEVYAFQTTKISVRYADPSRSRGATAWAALSSSVRGLLGVGTPISGLVGKKQTWKFMPCVLRQRSDEGVWSDQPGEAWRVIKVEGVGTGTRTEAEGDTQTMLVELADGKTDKQFNEAALAHTRVRADSAITSAVVEREVLPDLEKQGLISKDDEGVWHKVEGK